MQTKDDIRKDIRNLVKDPDNVQIDIDISTSTGEIVDFIRTLFADEYPDWYEESDFYELDTLVFRREEE